MCPTQTVATSTVCWGQVSELLGCVGTWDHFQKTQLEMATPEAEAVFFLNLQAGTVAIAPASPLVGSQCLVFLSIGLKPWSQCRTVCASHAPQFSLLKLNAYICGYIHTHQI